MDEPDEPRPTLDEPDEPRPDHVGRLAAGVVVLVLGCVGLFGAISVELAPRAPSAWRPHSEFGYGPHLAFPLPVYAVAAVVVLTAIYFAATTWKHRRSWPLTVMLAMVALCLVALVGGWGSSLLGPAHLAQYRAECAARSAAGCIAVSECAPSRDERVQALEDWCGFDPVLGCGSLGEALIRSVDWPETPEAERSGRIARGVALLTQACEGGAPHACRFLSGIYRSGRLLPADEARADEFWQTGERRLQRDR